MLVVANLLAMSVADGETVRTQPATLSTFRVGADGKLSFVQSYDVESGSATQWWSGMVGL
ncbi:MAG: hypothetical protein JO227_24985 [Acetobacteraceae bacterium]|nr:hypothetical protein [Acetobacteraceae bacterium]